MLELVSRPFLPDHHHVAGLHVRFRPADTHVRLNAYHAVLASDLLAATETYPASACLSGFGVSGVSHVDTFDFAVEAEGRFVRE